MSHEEIEVKFLLDDLTAMRQRLLSMGATLATPRTYEDNLCFDTPDQRLQQHGYLLRLRRGHRTLLTYKEPPAVPDVDFKVRHEYEIEVSDFALTRIMVEKLGFAPFFRYEKYRETFVYQEAEILLDEVPFGAFMEIEAGRETIGAIVATLGLDFAKRLRAGYGEIFHTIRTAYHLPFTDMTFDNFRGHTIDLQACNLT